MRGGSTTEERNAVVTPPVGKFVRERESEVGELIGNSKGLTSGGCLRGEKRIDRGEGALMPKGGTQTGRGCTQRICVY